LRVFWTCPYGLRRNQGYGGLSIFWSNGTVRENLDRVTDYARIMASVGLNAIVINNVNADSNILNTTNIAGMKRIADAMRPYGVQIGASMNFAAPMLLGNLSTFDPLDPGVVAFWQQKAAAIYAAVPDFAGYLIKANSEGQPGQSSTL
jgi:alpha-glucuronidase